MFETIMWSFLAGLLLVSSLSTVSCRSTKPGNRNCGVNLSFNDLKPYDNLPLPNCPDKLKISMSLQTATMPSGNQKVTKSTIPPGYDGSKETIFIVHGWTKSSKDKTWMTTMKDAFLEEGDYNVIKTDWDSTKDYKQSASDTRSVGAEIGLVAANLIAKGNSTKSRLYCVGYSLGAHVCGHAGMRTMFGRITGLDPAREEFEDRDRKAGLNPSSADLVDVIHTNTGLLGVGALRVLGHVDFYPNGGKQVQPGCVSLKPQKYGCSHHRSVDYYVESINSPCFNSRHKCMHEKAIPDLCERSTSVIQTMGFNAVNYTDRGIFYLKTNSKSPYCRT